MVSSLKRQIKGFDQEWNWTTTCVKYCTILLKLSLLQGQPVWWTVTLQRPGFVSKIWIINRLGCWFAQMPKHVSLSNSVKTEEANGKVYSWKDTRKTLMICEPLISASNVTIYEDGVDDLSLCEVMITAIGEKCKRFLFHVHWFSNSNLLMKTCHPPDSKLRKKNYCQIPPSLTRWPFWRAGTHAAHQKRVLDVDFGAHKTNNVNPDVKK